MTIGRTILHVDMDAFFASVEQRDHPEWRGRPVIVGAMPDRRGVVAAASYEARTFGVRSAMPSVEAGRRCPHAVFVAPDMARYQAASLQIMAIFERYTPWVEPLSIDEAFLDVTGSLGLFGDGRQIACRIRADILREIRLTATVGIAPNKFLAKLAGETGKPDGLVCAPDDAVSIEAFLRPLAVTALWGVGPVMDRRLCDAGIRRIGDLQSTDESKLAQMFGEHTARHLKQLALGVDFREVESQTQARGISREHTFEADCSDHREIVRMLHVLGRDVGRQLREQGKYAACVRVKLRRADFRTLTRQRKLDVPVCDDASLLETAAGLWRLLYVSYPVRLIGVGVQDLCQPPPRQLGLFDDAQTECARNEALSRVVDALRQRHGKNSCFFGDEFSGAAT